METFLLNALKEQGQADKYVAEQAIKFVKKLIENQHKLENKYLNKRRDCIKAPLAVYFGIISPEHIFKKMDPILKKIPWENYTTIQKGFEQFYCFLEKPFPPAYLYCNILPVHLYVLGEAPRATFFDKLSLTVLPILTVYHCKTKNTGRFYTPGEEIKT